MYLLYFAVNNTRTGGNVAPTAPPAWKLAIQRTSIQNRSATLRRMRISVIFVILSPLRVVPQKHLVATRWRNHTSVIYVIRSLHLNWIWSVIVVYIAKVRVISVTFVTKSFLWVLHSEFTLWVIWGWRHTIDVCLREFTRNEILKKHYITHTGEKPYKSNVCGKDFSQIANLQRDQCTPSGEKPYKCDFCWKAFSRSEHLKSHLEIHVLLWVHIFCFGMLVGLCSLCFFP